MPDETSCAADYLRQVPLRRMIIESSLFGRLHRKREAHKCFEAQHGCHMVSKSQVFLGYVLYLK